MTSATNDVLVCGEIKDTNFVQNKTTKREVKQGIAILCDFKCSPYVTHCMQLAAVNVSIRFIHVFIHVLFSADEGEDVAVAADVTDGVEELLPAAATE